MTKRYPIEPSVRPTAPLSPAPRPAPTTATAGRNPTSPFQPIDQLWMSRQYLDPAGDPMRIPPPPVMPVKP